MSQPNLKDFVKVSGNQNQTQLVHKDGHVVILNHSSLEPNVKDMVTQHFDDGGAALPLVSNSPSFLSQAASYFTSPPNVDPAVLQQNAALSAAQQAGSTLSRDQITSDPRLAAQADALAQQPSAAQAAPNSGIAPASYSTSGTMQNGGLGMGGSGSNPMLDALDSESKMYNQGFGEQKQGLTQEAAATGAQGKAEAQIYQDQQQQQQDAKTTFDGHVADLNDKRAQITDAISKQHLDGNKFWNDKSVPAKIEGTIGLILGGIGSGITHQPNMAAQMLQNSIDREVDAQKQNFKNNDTLLSNNRAQFQDETSAYNMTRAMLNDQVSSKLAQVAAQTKDPMAQARLLQAKGQLDSNAAANVGQTAMRRTMLQQMGNGQLSPEMTVKMMVPPAQQDAAYKELDRVKELGQSRQDALAAFEQGVKENTIGDTAKHLGLGTRPAEQAFQNALNPALRDADGKLNEAVTKPAYGLFKAPGDSQEHINQKRQDLLNLYKTKAQSSILSSSGIDPESVMRNQAMRAAQQRQAAIAASRPRQMPVATQQAGNANGG